MTANLTLRPITDDDLAFLHAVYASTRADELAAVDWTADQRAQFVAMQFRAQHVHYQQHFADASFDVVELAGIPIGRLYVHRRHSEIRIVDIALLEEYRGRGIGADLLSAILAEADAAGIPVTIHVEHQNPAMRLYQRLGFEPAGDTGVYTLMRRPPADSIRVRTGESC